MKLQELGLLLVLVAVAILTYASLVYFAEKDFSSNVDLNCTAWQPDYSKGGKLCVASKLRRLLTVGKWTSVINHPCYGWTFVEAFWWVGWYLHMISTL